MIDCSQCNHHYWEWDHEYNEWIECKKEHRDIVKLSHKNLIHAQNQLIEMIRNELDLTRQDAIIFIDTYMDFEIVDTNDNPYEYPKLELISSLKPEHEILKKLTDINLNISLKLGEQDE